MPLTLVDKDGSYLLPTGWHEVSTRQFCDLDRLQLATVEARASYFAGRAIQVNGLVADVLAFLLSEPPATQGLAYPPDLGQETYLQVETIRSLLAQPLHECYASVYSTFAHGKRMPLLGGVAEFSQERAADWARSCQAWAVTDTYPAVAHCLAELQRLNTKYAELSEPDTTEAGRKARAAGASSLDMFSHFNVALHYAQRYAKTVDEVYQWPFETVALMLLHDRRTAIIHDNLTKQPHE